MKAPLDGRRFVKEVLALTRSTDAGHTILAAPMPGFYRDAPMIGGALQPGSTLGVLEVLGVSHRLIVPVNVHGVVIATAASSRRLARRPIAYGEALLTIDPELRASIGTSNAAAESTSASAAGTLTFCAPMSGRYYSKPAPDAEPFVRVDEIIEAGQSVALFEVMKTFNRVQYGGAGVPARAKIVSILPSDGDDVRGGDPLFEIESA